MSMNTIELHHLRCIVAVAEELNFGKAASRMHLSQPPLTRLVADVEKQLGARLFERTTRQVRLTPIGEIFITEARAVLARVDEALQTVTTAIDRQSGQVRLAYIPLALQTVLPQLLSVFRQREHDARIDLVELPEKAHRAALEAGRIDLAFSHEPIRELGYSNVLLHREPLSLLVPETHPFATQTVVPLSALASETLVLHPRHEYPEYYDRVIAACHASGGIPTIRHREPGQNCIALVIGGQGLLLTATPQERLSFSGLRSVSVAMPEPLYEEIWGTWLSRKLSHRAAVLASLIQARGITD